MAQDIVGGLFGLQQQPDYAAQDYRNAMAMAELGTKQGMGRFVGGMLGSQLGRGLGQFAGGLLGVEDPRLAQASAIKEAQQQGFDVTTPEGLQQLAQFFVQRGQPGLASQVATQAQTMQQVAAKTKLEEAQAIAAIREKKGTAQNQAEQAIYDKYVAQFGPEQGALAFANWKNNLELQQRAAGRTVVNVSQQQESEFSKELGKIQGGQMKDAYNTRNAAIKTLDTLTKMSSLNDQELISGSFSGPRAATANFLNTVGLASNQDAKRLSNTQQFEKVAGDLVLANIKQLGYNPSNADVVFLNKTLPNLETSPQARKDLINWMGTKAQGSIAEVKNMEQYALKNRSLNGYVPAVPNFNPSGGSQTPSKTYKGKALSAMTTAELEAIKAELSK